MALPLHHSIHVTILLGILLSSCGTYAAVAIKSRIHRAVTLAPFSHNLPISSSRHKTYGKSVEIEIGPDYKSISTKLVEPMVSVSVVEVVNPRNRSKRSLQHIIESNKNQHIILKTADSNLKEVYLEMSLDGRAFCTTTFCRPKKELECVSKESAHMDILVFLPNTTLSVEEALRGIQLNGSDVLIRRFKTKTYLAMNEFGEIITERMENFTVTSNTIWKMEVSPYGLVFRHAYYPIRQQQNSHLQPAGAAEESWFLAVTESFPHYRLFKGNHTLPTIYWSMVSESRVSARRPNSPLHSPLYVGRYPLRQVLPASRDNLNNLIKSMRFKVCQEVRLNIEQLLNRQLNTVLRTLNRFGIGITLLMQQLAAAPYNWPLKRRQILRGHFVRWINLLREKKIKNVSRKISAKYGYALFDRRQVFMTNRKIRKLIEREVGFIFLELSRMLHLLPSEKLELFRNANLYYLLRTKLHMRIPPIKAVKRASYILYLYFQDSVKLFSMRDVFDIPNRKSFYNSAIQKKIIELIAMNDMRPLKRHKVLTLRNLTLCSTDVSHRAK